MTDPLILEQYHRFRLCRQFEALILSPDSPEKRAVFRSLSTEVRRSGQIVCDGMLYQWRHDLGSFVRSRIDVPHVARNGPGIRVVKTPVWLKESEPCSMI